MPTVFVRRLASGEVIVYEAKYVESATSAAEYMIMAQVNIFENFGDASDWLLSMGFESQGVETVTTGRFTQ